MRRCCCGRCCISPACKRGQSRLRGAWVQQSVTLDDIRRFRQIGSHAPGHPEYHLVSGVEADDRPAGAGHRHERGHGDGAEVARHALQPARLPDLRLPHLRVVRRRLPHGRRGRRGRVARRPSRPRQPLLDLRQQPHHDRRQHAHRLHRGRRRALPRLPVERAARGRRQRPRSHRARARRRPSSRRAGRR